MNYIIHDTAGQILRVVDCSEDQATHQAGMGESILQGDANDETEYISSGVVTVKPVPPISISSTNILADATEISTITNIPVGAELSIGGVIQGIVDDGSVELTADLPGDLAVKLSLFPYLDYEVTINAF